MTSRIISIEGDGADWILTGQLDDGTPDSDGVVVDPDWLLQAATQWLEERPALRGGARRSWWESFGTCEAVWQEDGVTMVRIRLGTQAGQLVRMGAITGMSIGVSRPTIHGSKDAPMGRIVGGRLEVGLMGDGPMTRHDEEN